MIKVRNLISWTILTCPLLTFAQQDSDDFFLEVSIPKFGQSMWEPYPVFKISNDRFVYFYKVGAYWSVPPPNDTVLVGEMSEASMIQLKHLLNEYPDTSLVVSDVDSLGLKTELRIKMTSNTKYFELILFDAWHEWGDEILACINSNIKDKHLWLEMPAKK